MNLQDMMCKLLQDAKEKYEQNENGKSNMLEDFNEWKKVKAPFEEDERFFEMKYDQSASPFVKALFTQLVNMQNEIDELKDKVSEISDEDN
jgi:hypothetical protein